MKYIEGVNTMNQTKTLRKLAIFVLIFAGLLTLAACKGGEKTPYGSISEDPYLTIGNITVTEKELYDQLRLQGASVLATMVDEKIFKAEIDAARALILAGDEGANKFLNETINNALHGSSDLEALEKLYTESQDRFVRNIEQFADSLYLLDNSIDIAAVKASILGLPEKYENYASIPLLLERYILRVAQRVYARGLLAEEVLKEKDANYISDQNLVNYYTTSVQGRYDVDALVIRFINLNEANAALYKVSIKSDSKGLWYRVPDIRIADSNDPYYVDLNDEAPQTGNGHIVSILTELGILSKLGPNRDQRGLLSEEDYENYYKRYVISTTRTNALPDEALTAAEVKAEFVNIYNILNPANKVEIVGGAIVAQAGSSFSSRLTYDEVNKINASLRVHIYTTLTAETSIEDIEDLSSKKPFSSRIQTFGNYRYLVYKLDDESETEDGILVEETEGSTTKIFGTSPEALAAKQDAFDKLFESKLSNNYIQSKVKARYDELTLDIYDKVVRTFYEQAYGYTGTTKTRSGNVLASIKGEDIFVDEFFEKLEISYGINVSLDIVSNKVLLASTKYTIEKSKMDSFKKQFEDIISQFSADNFASSGFPASMGREKFLMLAFGSTTNTEAINQLYVYPELRNQYIEDIESHYGNDTETIYHKLAELAELQYTQFKSINVSHLLVYFDGNGDGQPDNPATYLADLDAATQQEIKDGLVDLVELIYDRLGSYRGHVAGLTAIANEFNNSGRIERGSVTPPFDYQIEQLWAKYRRLGFHLKYEAISSAITNTSNFITGQTTLDKVFYDRAMAIENTLSLMPADDSKFPYLDLYGTVITETALDEVMSSFGWHLILATATGTKTSAIFSEDSDEDGKYVSQDGTLNVYNEDSETLTASQIEFYLKEQKSDLGVVLPTTVQTAVTNYLTPVLNRYKNTYMQRELIFQLVEDVTFANGNSARFNLIRQINLRQLNEYLLSDTGVKDLNYQALYGSWFDILN